MGDELGGRRAMELSSDYSRGGYGVGGGNSGGSSSGKHVVVVMDALKEFSIKPLEWALEHVVEPGSMLTLLGVTPWLSLPLLCKTWLDIWTLDLGGMPLDSDERVEWNKDPKHQRLSTISGLCEARGVMLLMKVVMGHPVKLMVVEQTTNLHATWIVFDRYHRKRSSFYKKRIPCNMVMMKENGKVEVLRRMMDSAEVQPSTMSFSTGITSTELMNSKEWIDFLKKQSERRDGQ